MSERQTCTLSQQEFTITDDDVKFYEKLGVPAPTLCPIVRLARRMSFRNERVIYYRKCDVTGKKIVSSFHESSPHKVFDKEYWYSEQFDPMNYGRDFDFSRPFFDQFHEFLLNIPLPSLRVESSENCDFNSDTGKSKDCYLCSRTHESEKMLYCYRGNQSSECVDCRQVRDHCEMLYECIECSNCYNSQFLEHCAQCVDCSYLHSCTNCNNCFLCTGLERKQFYFMNEKYTKEAYEKKISEFNLKSQKDRKLLIDKFTDLKKNIPKSNSIINSDDCTGSSIFGSKSCHQCYDIQNIQDGRYLFNINNSTDVCDCYSGKKQELNYECTSCSRSYNTKFSMRVTDSSDCDYCLYSRNSKHLFACIGLKQNSYCIFNKQYSKEEYFALREKIIEHMKKTKEWGEFFPISIAPFAYNETVAQEFFPISKEFSKSQNWRWQPKDTKEYKPSTFVIPDNIDDVDESICKEVLACKETGKNYKITAREFDFYKKMEIPIPLLCPDVRYNRRAKAQKVPMFEE